MIYRNRRQAGRLRRLVHQIGVPRPGAGQLPEPVIVDQVGPRHHAQAPGRRGGEVRQALGVGGLVGEQAAGENPVREVVHPAPALPAHADHVAHVQQPLDGDLGI
jgi:hypothetical protein